MTDDHDTLQHRAERLGLYGLLDHWGEISDSALIAELLGWEENERHRRSLERRIRNARIGSFKPLTDFEWDWPEQIDREQIRDLLNMEWPDEAMNVILVGPNGVGKSMLAKNLGYQALLNGHTVRFTTASEMLNDLAAQEGAQSSLQVHRTVSPTWPGTRSTRDSPPPWCWLPQTRVVPGSSMKAWWRPGVSISSISSSR